jgi:hypothetical protein
MPKTVYAVLEVAYEYNDETYSAGDSNGGFPEHIFLTKEAAQKYADKKNLEQMRGLNLAEYCYDIEDLIEYDWRKKENKEAKVKEVSDWFRALSEDPEEFTLEDNYNLEIPTTASDEDIAKLYNLLNLEFFTVVESKLVEE